MKIFYEDNSGNTIYGEPYSIKGNFTYEFNGKNCVVYIGNNVNIKNVTIVMGGDNNEISIGDNCSIKGELRTAHRNSKIIIGKNTEFNGPCRLHAAEGKLIKIGENCLFANPRFRTSDSHSILSLDDNKRINFANDIVIENEVWIAEDVYIYKGVTVGKGSVIGARSTVTKNLPSHSLCIGTPAAVVKSNISWCKKKLI